MAVQQASVDGNLAATYTYIYSFLLKKEHSKAAEALKKAVKDEWKELKEKAASKSSDSSDSDSDSECMYLI
ncbi:hypothetical protein C8Q70DRAFT_10098 [Cubamyces menziesii]|nr:hypothetical protein C8Q70DRAFT_10098 [Cubamyces menziesii]